MTQETKNYELLVRYHDNGKVGASTRQITSMFDEEGNLVGTRLEEPKELTFFELSQIVYGIKLEDWYTPPVSEDSEL